MKKKSSDLASPLSKLEAAVVRTAMLWYAQRPPIGNGPMYLYAMAKACARLELARRACKKCDAIHSAKSNIARRRAKKKPSNSRRSK